jgi:hypothetical protein
VSAPVKLTFLEALDDELERPSLLKFRLAYEGELRATQRDPTEQQSNHLAGHKHAIRRIFHKQLKQLWAITPLLSSYKRARQGDIGSRPIQESGAWFDHADDTKIPLLEYVTGNFNINGYRFVPLICEEFSLLCSLNILFLRRDIPGSAISAGDIDNRVKTIIDTLTMPIHANEMTGNETPQAGEDPFFCLMENDKLVSHFEVETDTLLDEPQMEDAADNRKARVIITVEIRPYLPTHFNLAFS